ncbi:MAG: Rpn family recombination-promoting nuclease/putative transposase [Clostridia bacterium]|nr:Rpn family recombination-promoting nuclease/putative transposase [Clostridia bacterium]
MDLEKKKNEKKELNAKNDVIFKELFSKKGNEDLLIDLLSNILGEKITKIDITKDVSLNRDVYGEKYGILDIGAEIDGKKYVDIEMQVAEDHYLLERLEYYASKRISHDLESGHGYNELREVIEIALVDYIMFPDLKTAMHKSLRVLNEDRNYELKSLHKEIIVEMPKMSSERKWYK